MTLAILIAALEDLKREHGPGCNVRVFEVAIYKNGFMHRVQYNNQDYVNVRLDPLSLTGAQG